MTVRAGKPVYPFGFGLSFTEFAHELVSDVRTRVDAAWLAERLGGDHRTRHEAALVVRVVVTNAGAVHDGAEVVLAFSRSPQAVSGENAATAPRRTLAAFERTGILRAGGGRQLVELTVKARDLGPARLLHNGRTHR